MSKKFGPIEVSFEIRQAPAIEEYEHHIIQSFIDAIEAVCKDSGANYLSVIAGIMAHGFGTCVRMGHYNEVQELADYMAQFVRESEEYKWMRGAN